MISEVVPTQGRSSSGQPLQETLRTFHLGLCLTAMEVEGHRTEVGTGCTSSLLAEGVVEVQGQVCQHQGFSVLERSVQKTSDHIMRVPFLHHQEGFPFSQHTLDSFFHCAPVQPSAVIRLSVQPSPPAASSLPFLPEFLFPVLLLSCSMSASAPPEK